MKRTSFSPKGEGAPAPLQDAEHPSIKTIASLTGSDRLLDLILQNTGDLVVMLDKDGKRTYNSPSHREVPGNPDALRGAKAFLQKPYQPADILRVIRGVIDVSGHVEKEVPS